MEVERQRAVAPSLSRYIDSTQQYRSRGADTNIETFSLKTKVCLFMVTTRHLLRRSSVTTG